MFPRRSTDCRLLPLLLIPAFFGVSAALGAGGRGGPTGDRLIYELTPDYTWGYWCGVKQPLGAFLNGLSIHQLTDSNHPIELMTGNPDHILWVDENNGTHGVSIHPTGSFSGNVTHPGGMATFADDGTIWYTIGGRAVDLPLDLYQSDAPYDVNNFSIRLDDWETYSTSTTPCVGVNDPKLLLFWRHGYSSGSETTVRLRRYDLNIGFTYPEHIMDIGSGCMDPVFGQVGIEQLYTRFDPRFDYHFVTWQWWDYPGIFGSNPFLYSDDDGGTWRTADGQAIVDPPVSYSDRNDILIPHDNIGIGDHAAWNVRDIGVSPNGTFWITLPEGWGPYDNEWWLNFWLFNGASWEKRTLTERMIGQSKPHACGATKDYLVLVYSEYDSHNVLKGRISADDGVTWSNSIVLDVLGGDDAISWVSYAQPSGGYDDNLARFFYAFYPWSQGWLGKRYMNKYKWIRFRADASLLGDVTGDGVVNVDDLLAVIAVWGDCPGCLEDLNGDGTVNVMDVLVVLAGWGWGT